MCAAGAALCIPGGSADGSPVMGAPPPPPPPGIAKPNRDADAVGAAAGLKPKDDADGSGAGAANPNADAGAGAAGTTEKPNPDGAGSAVGAARIFDFRVVAEWQRGGFPFGHWQVPVGFHSRLNTQMQGRAPQQRWACQ